MTDYATNWDMDGALRHSDWLRKLAEELVGDPGVAHDLTTDAFSVLEARRREGGRGIVRDPRSFLRAVLCNLVRRHVRSEERRDRRERAASVDEALPSTAELASQLEIQRLLIEELAGMGAAARETILLRHYHGLSSAEIARRQGIAPATVRARLKRGLDELRARLDRKYPDRRSWAVLVGAYARIGGGKAAPTASPLLLPGVVVSMSMAMKVGAAVVFAVSALWLALQFAGEGNEVEVEQANAVVPTPPAEEDEASTVALASTDVAAGRTPLDTESTESDHATDTSLRLRVLDADGSPAAELAAVLVAGEGDPLRMQTDGDGVLELAATGQTGSLVLARRNAPPHLERIDLVPGEAVVRLPRGEQLAGYVVVDGMPPKEPILLTLESDRPPFADEALITRLAELVDFAPQVTTTTDDDGAFSFAGLSPGWSGVLYAPHEYRRVGRKYEYYEEDRIHFDAPGTGHRIELHAFPIVRGRIVEADLVTPVPHARCLATARWRNGSLGLVHKADAEGRFAVPMNDERLTCIDVQYERSSGTGASLFTVEVASLDRSYDLGDLPIDPGRAIAFRAIDRAGVPIAGAVASYDTGSVCSAPTGANGRGGLDKLPDDVRQFMVVAPGYRLEFADVPYSETEVVDVVLTPTNRLTIVVRAADGSPLADRLVELVVPRLWTEADTWTIEQGMLGDAAAGQIFYRQGLDDGATKFGFLLAPEGKVVVQHLPAIPFTVCLQNRMQEVVLEEELAPLSPTEERSLELRPPADLHMLAGRVIDRDGVPLVGAEVNVTTQGDVTDMVRSDELGRFAIPELMGEMVRVDVLKLGFACAVVEYLFSSPDELVIVLEEGLDVVVEIPPRGTLADENIVVTAHDPAGLRYWKATPLGDGRWSLADLPNEEVVIEVDDGEHTASRRHHPTDPTVRIRLDG